MSEKSFKRSPRRQSGEKPANNYKGPRVTNILFSEYRLDEAHPVKRAMLDRHRGLSVDKVADRSLRTDLLDKFRHQWGYGDFSDGYVTLVSDTEIARASEGLSRPLTPQELRRQLIVTGVNTEGLQGEQFRIGSVLLTGLEVCDPLDFIGYDMTGPRAEALTQVTGIAAKIQTNATIIAGSPVHIEVPIYRG